MNLGRRGLAWFAALAAVLALLAWGCAKRGAPPGGPEDKTPPYVESLSPAGGSVGVDLKSDIRITFSEPMKRRTVETAVVVSPPRKWAKRYWEKNTYILVSGSDLLEETTYLVAVGTASADRHGVKMDRTFVAGFSTGATIEAGVISGRTIWKGVSVEQALVQVFDAAEVGGFTEFPETAPVYVTYSGAGGEYEIPFVNPRRVYKVIAILDKNGNAEHDKGETIGCALGEVALADSARAVGVNVALCDADFRGAIEGSVETIWAADTTGGRPEFKVGVVANPATDTSEAYRALCGQGGEFRITCVRPGPYVLEAFVDFNGNQRKDAEDTFHVELADTVTVESCAEPVKVEMTLEAGSKP